MENSNCVDPRIIKRSNFRPEMRVHTDSQQYKTSDITPAARTKYLKMPSCFVCRHQALPTRFRASLCFQHAFKIFFNQDPPYTHCLLCFSIVRAFFCFFYWRMRAMEYLSYLTRMSSHFLLAFLLHTTISTTLNILLPPSPHHHHHLTFSDCATAIKTLPNPLRHMPLPRPPQRLLPPAAQNVWHV